MADIDDVIRSFPQAERIPALTIFRRVAERAHELDPTSWACREHKNKVIQLYCRKFPACTLEMLGANGHVWLALDKPTVDATPGLSDALRTTPQWMRAGAQYASYKPGATTGYLRLDARGLAFFEQLWPALDAFIAEPSPKGDGFARLQAILAREPARGNPGERV